MSVKFQDYYATLGVSRDASEEEIRRAYRKLARKHHPDVDKTAGATQRFAQIGEAYEVLKDKKKRERYDALGANWKEGQDFTPPSGWQEVRFGRGSEGGFEGFEFGSSGFSSFFDTFFGNLEGQPYGRASSRRGAGGARARAPRAGASLEAVLEIGLEDLHSGAAQTITLQPQGGDGSSRTYDVKIPPGTRSGSVIRLRGQGGPGSNGGPPGDLLMRIEIRPHPRYAPSGESDLATVLPIAPWEAALGAKIGLRTLDGGESLLTVPPGSSSGKKLRMRGMGLPREGGTRGDLLVELRIAVPASLSVEEKRLFEELSRASKFDPRQS
ncbi:MAG: DnaJ C-terminal domain-containing protein [Planctomycetota bacterium]